MYISEKFQSSKIIAALQQTGQMTLSLYVIHLTLGMLILVALKVGWNTGRADIWRFESQQLRMKASLFEDQEGYDWNSPIRQVKKVTTPLLSCTGKEDFQVNWSNSVSLYLAMRRLQKKHIMLLYLGEGHNLRNPMNQLDLSVRVHQWFDYLLKDAPAAAWIAEGLK